MRIILGGVRQIEQRFHGWRQQTPAALADALGCHGKVEECDHGRRPLLAATAAHRLLVILGKEPQADSASKAFAAFRTTAFLGIFDQPNGETFHTTAPIASFGPMFTK